MKEKRQRKIALLAGAVLLAVWPGRVMAQVTEPHEAVSASGASVTAADGTEYSSTLGQAVAAPAEGTLDVASGVQQMFCLPYVGSADYAICPGQAAAFVAGLPAGFELPAGVTPTVAGQYGYEMHLLTEGGCDSLTRVRLTVHAQRDTELYAQASGCYAWRGTDYAASGDYTAHLVTAHGCDSTVTLHLALLSHLPLPTIYAYRERLLFIDHHYGGDSVYYGGYRWYRNGELMAEGLSADSYQTLEGGRLDGCYYLEVPADGDGSRWVRSNTLCFGSTAGIAEAESVVALDVMPNPVAQGAQVRVVAEVEGVMPAAARLEVYDMQGRRLMELPAQEVTTFAADLPSGLYSLHLVLPDGRRGARRLVVR